jgi:hypothetical protein
MATIVTATDQDTGETGTCTIEDNYVLVCSGTCRLADTQVGPDGARVLIVTGRREGVGTPEILRVDTPGKATAVQWWCSGDHPSVTAGVHPTRDEDHVCGACGRVIRDHGWIESTIVCPGDWVITTPDGRHWPVRIPGTAPESSRSIADADIRDLIGRSSLGTPGAVAARATVPVETAEQVVARAMAGSAATHGTLCRTSAHGQPWTGMCPACGTGGLRSTQHADPCPGPARRATEDGVPR